MGREYTINNAERATLRNLDNGILPSSVVLASSEAFANIDGAGGVLTASRGVSAFERTGVGVYRITLAAALPHEVMIISGSASQPKTTVTSISDTVKELTTLDGAGSAADAYWPVAFIRVPS